VALGETLLWVAAGEVTGEELWRCPAASPSMVLVKDIRFGANGEQ
jgi:ELWxxDGT repeat protein